ncbi:unnamed protein product, partial [Symbiodinium microadriaticum]
YGKQGGIHWDREVPEVVRECHSNPYPHREHAFQWMHGRPVSVPLMQRGFALSREWSLNQGDVCIIITASRSHFMQDPSDYF